MRIIQGDCLKVLRRLANESVQCCVTSPPYWGLRDYGVQGQLGLERTPEEYVSRMVEVFREVRRVLRNDGTLWLNLGDCYATGGGKANQPGGGYRGAHEIDKKRPKWAGPYCQPNRMPIHGLKPKDLVGMPWRVAFALQADGWYLRSDTIWHKPNPMPESVKDRPTRAHEYLFLLSKSKRYYYDAKAISEPCTSAAEQRNRRSVWIVTTRPFKGAHFATFPPQLIEPCILAGCPEGGIVLDPFNGAGTTGLVALEHGRDYIGIELNRSYIRMSTQRLRSAIAPLKRKSLAA